LEPYDVGIAYPKHGAIKSDQFSDDDAGAGKGSCGTHNSQIELYRGKQVTKRNSPLPSP